MINDSNKYTINKEKLSVFKSDGNIKERLDRLYESAKHHIAKHLDYNLWLMCDLVFNSILDFRYDEVMKGRTEDNILQFITYMIENWVEVDESDDFWSFGQN